MKTVKLLICLISFLVLTINPVYAKKYLCIPYEKAPNLIKELEEKRILEAENEELYKQIELLKKQNKLLKEQAKLLKEQLEIEQEMRKVCEQKLRKKSFWERFKFGSKTFLIGVGIGAILGVGVIIH